MDFNTYQDFTDTTAIYPEAGLGTLQSFTYVSLGLAGEAGEVCERIKKIIRDTDGQISSGVHDDLVKEAGDVLWYLARLCRELHISMDDIAQINMTKLSSRKERGVLGGSGDNR